MGGRTSARRAALPSLLAALAGAACSFGESGVAPPGDRLFFPSGMAVDPSGRWLYVANGNADLLYNAGTVAAIDLERVDRDRARAAGADVCPRDRYAPGTSAPADFCCRDFLRPNVLVCDERAYIDADASVRIGSFSARMTLQEFTRGGAAMQRLFVAVRADPSITFIDVIVGDGAPRLNCRGTPGDPSPALGRGAACSDAFRIRRAGAPALRLDLPEEPHGFALDTSVDVLYAGHLDRGGAAAQGTLSGGLSVVDVCGAAAGVPPRLAGVAQRLFPNVDRLQGVASLSVPDISAGAAPGTVFAAARSSFDVAQVVVPGAGAACDPAAPRDLSAVASTGLSSTAFSFGSHGFESMRGTELAAFLLSADGQRAYVLHRNSRRVDPAALVVIDRRADERGIPRNQATDVIEVCAGAAEMQWHDAGRGRRLYVTCYEAGQVLVLDPDRLGAAITIDVGRAPVALAFSPTDPTRAYVASYVDHSIAVLDLTRDEVMHVIGFPGAR